MPVFVETEVGGIQKFIFNTGKLKEMIGGSEIIYHICQPAFFTPVLEEIGCQREAREETSGNDWHMLLQNNAGVLALLLPDEEKGHAFLSACSQKILENFPTLPYFGAQTPMAWSNRSLKDARERIHKLIEEQRMRMPPPCGIPMLPLLRPSRLDGQPAVALSREAQGREFISLSSLCKRDHKILDMSKRRLQAYAGTPDNVIWTNDMEVMLPNGGKVALLHMDGNDMGKLFGSMRDRHENNTLAENVAAMRELSNGIEELNREAFAYATGKMLDYLLHHDPGSINKDNIIMPMRPLVIGGDDITLLIRADLALFFINLFVSRYEKLAARKNLSLSLGIGMVVMDSSWPFAKAFALTEDLTKNAKKITVNPIGPRPSSLDYLVLTEDVDKDVSALRKRVFTSIDGASLTGKPLLLGKNRLLEFMEDGREVLDTLPRSALRPAIAACQQGIDVAARLWLDTRENLNRRLGGRHGRLMNVNRFTHIFPDNFFITDASRVFTRLGDYLELAHLMPSDEDARNELLKLMLQEEKENV